MNACLPMDMCVVDFVQNDSGQLKLDAIMVRNDHTLQKSDRRIKTPYWSNPEIFNSASGGKQQYKKRSLSKSIIYSKIDEGINRLRYLSNNWDSYGAPAPNSLSLKRAENLAKYLSDKEAKPTKIMPLVDGGISFVFIAGEKYASIECDNDGDILCGMSDRVDTPKAWEIRERESEILGAIENIIGFLAG